MELLRITFKRYKATARETKAPELPQKPVRSKVTKHSLILYMECIDYIGAVYRWRFPICACAVATVTDI